MVARHCACLTALASAVSRAAADGQPDDLGTPELGLPLVQFAGELAAALQLGQFRSELPDDLVRACEQTVTTATLTAAEAWPAWSKQSRHYPRSPGNSSKITAAAKA